MALFDVRVGIRALLLGSGSISAAVDSGASASPRYRIFPIKVPQGERRTSIVYSRISNVGDHHMQGASGLSRPRVQIDCWAPTANAASELADLVKELIDGFKGSILWGEASPEEAIVVQGIFFDSERDNYDAAIDMYGVSRDYIVWFEEA